MREKNGLEDRIEEHVAREDYKAVKPAIIAKQLKIDEEDLREFKRAIKRLIKKGRISWGAKHLVMKSSEKKSRQVKIFGRFRSTRKGFGVVQTLPETPFYGQTNVHIPAQSCLDAVRGDLVCIRIIRDRPGRDIEFGGRVLEVVERKTHRFVGSYFEDDGWAYVDIDGYDFFRPVEVGDAGAKNASPGDKVVIEMVRFPSNHTEGEAVVIKVLGPQGKPGVDTLLIMNQYGLEGEFPESVLENSRQQASQFDESIGDNRCDFTDQPVVTIDPQDARDFDDAISLKKLKNGHWLLGVHIADVSHFVKPSTPLDDEAYQRGTSVYLPDRVIPMLPEIISNNLASLQPDRVRYAMSAFIEFTEDGARVSTEIKRTAIKSQYRFTYEDVDDFLQRPIAWRRKLSHGQFDLLGRMHQLAMILRGRRQRDGAIELHLPEVKIDLNGQGQVVGAKVAHHTESHQVIEEFMLAANEAVAQLFVDSDLLLLRRIHPQPDPRKLDELTQFVRGLGINCDNLASRFEIQRLLANVADKPEKRAVNFAILRSMSKAKYSPEEEGHYALGSKAYCHFTSPIRRYPDLVVHRMAGALADGRKPSVDQSHLERLAAHCCATEENAERAERDLKKLKLLGFFVDKIGKRLKATITGVRQSGLFAEGIELPVAGFISTRSLPAERYQFDSRAQAITGFGKENQFRLGDQISVRVSRVDLDRRELDFVIDDGRSFKDSNQRSTQPKTKFGGPPQKSNRGKNPPKKGQGSNRSKSKAKSGKTGKSRRR